VGLELAGHQEGPRGGGMILSDLGAEASRSRKMGGRRRGSRALSARPERLLRRLQSRQEEPVHDLRTPRGKEVFAALVADRDVVLRKTPSGQWRRGSAYGPGCAR